MRQGSRKFFGFLITVLLYTVVVLAALLRGGAVTDMAVFSMHVSLGYCGICGLFFGSNVLEHFSGNKKEQKELV